MAPPIAITRAVPFWVNHAERRASSGFCASNILVLADKNKVSIYFSFIVNLFLLGNILADSGLWKPFLLKKLMEFDY
jgi:hypothetical protein